MPPAARVTDMHTCPMVNPGPVPHVGGPILPPGAPTVLIDFLPAATVSNMLTCVGPPDTIAKGSAGVFINHLPAARLGDTTAHGGVIILGSPNVIIGEMGAPSPGAAGLGGVSLGLAASGLATPASANKSIYATPFKAKPASASSSTKALPAKKATAAAKAAPAPAPFSCKSAWATTVAHTNSIANMQDPIARNKLISADYAQMFQKDPDLQWAGLGAIVSRQAGCGMAAADAIVKQNEPLLDAEMQSPSEGGDIITPVQTLAAQQAKDALADANQLIYRTVSPTMSFVQQHGAKQMQSCLKSGDIPTADTLSDTSIPNDKVDNSKVPTQLASAVDNMASGNNRRAADQIAAFEQRTVVQDRIYNDSANKAVFGANQWMSNWLGPVGRFFGAQPNTIPLSADCTSAGHIPFDGSILNADDRVNYYQDLMNGFVKNGPQWQQTTMQQIVNQGK